MDYLNNSRLQDYEDLQNQHTEKGSVLEANANAVAVALQASDWQTGKEESQKTITSFQEVIDIDVKIIDLAQKLGLDEDVTMFQKRKEAEEAIMDFYVKTIECADFILADDEEGFKTCDQEAGEAYENFSTLTEEYQALQQ